MPRISETAVKLTFLSPLPVMMNLSGLAALNVNHGMISVNHPASTGVVGIPIPWILAVWCPQYSLAHIHKTRRTKRRTLCGRQLPQPNIRTEGSSELARHKSPPSASREKEPPLPPVPPKKKPTNDEEEQGHVVCCSCYA